MSKENKRNKDVKKDKKTRIPKETLKKVSEFVSVDWNTFKKKKKNKEYYSSKKEMKLAYLTDIQDMLPDVIHFCVKYGHFSEALDIKTAAYNKIFNEAFLKFIIKDMKKYDYEFDNMDIMPVMINEAMLVITAKKEVKANIEQKDEKVVKDENDELLGYLLELSKLIMKKKLKKFKKAGIDEKLAMDVLFTIPSMEIMKYSPAFRIRSFVNVLYLHAKENDIPFEKIMKIVFKDNDIAVKDFIKFSLLEKKDKLQGMTEKQKSLFNTITMYCFTTLEEMSAKDIYAMLLTYAKIRKEDEAQQKDANRRYYISSLPEDEYPRICKTLNRIIEQYEDLKKYF